LLEELKEYLEKYKDKFTTEDVENIEDIITDLDQNAKKINEHGKRADSIVRSMLQHSRGKSGIRQVTDINAMLEEDLNLAYHGMRAQDSEFNITIEKKFDETIGDFEVVPQDISRVFLNIITNGFYEAYKRKTQNGKEFSPKLSVISKNLEKQIEIRIRDNGNGIPASIRDKLFEPFFTTKPTGQGTGLGLSLSYDIVVKEHNGELAFETEDGKFTEFIIKLPRTL
jgi:signal transduction histidine kinase